MSIESLLLLFLSLVLFGVMAQSVRKGRSWGKKRQNTDSMLRIRAIAGNASARYRLGVRHMERSQDVAAFKWLRKSAGAGNSAAQNAVGMMYEHGRGVAKDCEAAARWYQKAAVGGFADGAVNLGNLYALGRGVKKDYTEALRWLEEAAAKGGRHAKNSLSWLLATCPDAEIRNGRQAIAVLGPFVSRGERHPVLLDTLAAAYAETGMFDEARGLISEALAKTAGNAQPGLYEQMQRRKGFYETGKPWREPPDGGPSSGGQETIVVSPQDNPERSVAAGTQPAPTLSGEHADLAAIPSDEPEALVIDPGRPKEVAAEARAEEQIPNDNIVTDTAASYRGESAGEGQEALSHVDYIVEKLLVIEELLRPLKAHQGATPEAVPSAGAALSGGPRDSDTGAYPMTVESTDEAGPGRQRTTQFADAFVDALLAERYGEIYRKMEKSFRTAVPEDQVGPMLEQMYDAYGGKPLEARLKTEESGYRMNGGGQNHVHKFWYSLRSARMERDAFELFVEILPEDDSFVCSSFFITPARKSPGE